MNPSKERRELQREAVAEAKADKLDAEAQELRLLNISSDEKEAAGDALDNLLRSANRLAEHFGLNIEGRLDAVRKLG